MGSNDSKSGDHMLITGIVIGAVAVVTWVAVPLFYSAPLHFYARFALVLFAVLVFAVLRMYNAVVGNTRYNIHLIKAVTELRKSLVPLGTLIQTHKTALGVNGTKVKSAADSVERLREVLESLRTKR